MALKKWCGTVSGDRLLVLRQLQHVFSKTDGVRRFRISNGYSVEGDRLLLKTWDRHLDVEICPNLLFDDFRSSIPMVEYELVDPTSLSEALHELLKPPIADIHFLLECGSNQLSLFKKEDGRPSFCKDIKLRSPKEICRPAMVTASSNRFVEPKIFISLYEFLKEFLNGGTNGEVAQVSFEQKSCQVLLGHQLMPAKDLEPEFQHVVKTSFDLVTRNKDVPPKPVWVLDISVLMRLYEKFFLEPKPLVYFGDDKLVAEFKTSSGIVVARVHYLNDAMVDDSVDAMRNIDPWNEFPTEE